MRYVALLRGINVGGNNIIRMTALKQCFERSGFKNVVTYIQSGNVLFDAPKQNAATLTKKVEKMLSNTFGYGSKIVLVSHVELKKIIQGAPRGFGQSPAHYRYDVVFLKSPLTAREAMKQISLKEGVDKAYAGKGVLYFSRLTSKATQSRLNKVAALPIYKHMTIRNWNTSTKLLGLMTP